MTPEYPYQKGSPLAGLDNYRGKLLGWFGKGRPASSFRMNTLIEQIAETSMPGVLGLGEFMALSLKKPAAIVEGLFNERQNIIFAGQFGVGKTMFALPLSLCLATGTRFLGRGVLRPYKTAVIDFENDEGEIQSRLGRQLKGLGLANDHKLLSKNWLYTNATRRGSCFYGKEFGKEANNFLAAVKPEILVIDNLGRAYGELDEPYQVQQFYSELGQFRERHPTLNSMIFLHHIVKMPKTRGGEAPYSLLRDPYQYLSLVRGSGRLLDYAETRLAIAKEGVGSEERYIVNGINRSARVSPLVLRLNEQNLCFIAEDRNAVEVAGAFRKRDRQLELFRLAPFSFTFTEIESLPDSSGKKFSKTTVTEMLRNGCKCGLLDHNQSTGVYSKRQHDRSGEERVN